MPPHQYSFHTAILGTNRQINSEATKVFYRQNLFVSLTCEHPKFGRKMASFVVVATGHHAGNFKHCSMEVHLGPHRHSDEVSQLPCEKLIIAGEDVTSFCNMLPRIYFECYSLRSGENRTSTHVFVQVNADGVADIENGDTGPENDCPLVKRLLEPFCHLHGMRIRVGGFVTPSYKQRIEQCAARAPPTAAELISIVSKHREEGNEATRKEKLVTAAKRYESALEMLDSGYIRLTARPARVEATVPPRKKDLAEMNALQIYLRSTLASTYLTLGEHSKSYRCAQDLGLSRSYVFWYHSFPEVSQLWRVCGHIMFCKALAGKELGQPVQALMDLDLGLYFDRFNKRMVKEREVLCGLLPKKLDSDLEMKWACALPKRSKNPKRRQDFKATQIAVEWKHLETLIKGNYVT